MEGGLGVVGGAIGEEGRGNWDWYVKHKLINE